MNTTTTTSPPAGPTATGPLTPTDHRAFAFLGQVNSCLRQCLCTLARNGVALRRREPARARLLLDTVRPWPFYKGGQFLFDLMEWEDLMVDGAPPPLMSAERITSACSPSVQWLIAATAEGPTATKLIPGQRTAAVLDLPLRLLATSARAALQGAAQDLTDLLGTPVPQDEGEQHAGQPTDPDADADDDEPPPLEAGFYLYEDIVLGALVVLGPLLADHAPADTPTTPGGD